MSESRPFTLEELAQILDDLHSEFQRSVNQSVLKHDHEQGMAGLGAMDCIQRLETRIRMNWPEYRFPAHSLELDRQAPPPVSPLRGKRL